MGSPGACSGSPPLCGLSIIASPTSQHQTRGCGRVCSSLNLTDTQHFLPGDGHQVIPPRPQAQGCAGPRAWTVLLQSLSFLQRGCQRVACVAVATWGLEVAGALTQGGAAAMRCTEEIHKAILHRTPFPPLVSIPRACTFFLKEHPLAGAAIKGTPGTKGTLVRCPAVLMAARHISSRHLCMSVQAHGCLCVQAQGCMCVHACH